MKIQSFLFVIAIISILMSACGKPETQEVKSDTPQTVQTAQLAEETPTAPKPQEAPAPEDNQNVAQTDTAQTDSLQPPPTQADAAQAGEPNKIDSNAPVPPETTDSSESTPTIKKINPANKYVFETIKSWTPIFESCVPADYDGEIYIKLEYNNKGKFRKIQRRSGNVEAYNCIKEKIQDFHFNIDVEAETKKQHSCYANYGIIALKYSNHKINFGYDTKGIGWRYTKCY